MLKYLILLSGILTVGFGFLVFFSKPKKPLHITFLLMSLTFGGWIFLNLWFQNNQNETIFKLILSESMLMPLVLFAWSYFLTEKKKYSENFQLFLGSIATAFLLINLFIWLTPFIVDKVYSTTNVSLGNLFFVYAVYMVSLVIAFLTYLIKIYKKTTNEYKRQLKYVIVGFFLFLGSASLCGVVLPALGIDKFANFDSPSSILFLFFSAIAVLRHKLFGIEVIGTIFLTVVLWIVLITKAAADRGSTSFNLDLLVIVLAFTLGIILIRSVLSEIKKRTELQLLTSELSNANTKLEEVDAMKTEFISMASHELLTPISAIKGYLSMILDEKLVKIEDENAVKYLDSIYKSSNRLAKLVADLLNVSRIEQARLLVAKEEINLEEVATSVVDELKFKAEEKKHSLKICGSDKVAKAYGDIDKVKEVLVNFCGNAIKYTPDGGEISVCIHRVETKKIEEEYSRMEKISVEKAAVKDSSLQNAIDPKLRQLIGDHQFVVCVTDNGAGLSDDDLSHLFKKFSRVGDFTTQKVQGTGLGLYISRALIEMQHGRTWAVSDGRGKGSTFCFSLPELSNKAELEKLDSEVEIAKDAKPLAKS